jgi:hypothetical protein
MKMKVLRILPLLGLLLGMLGVGVCLVAIIIVWSTGSRLTQANDKVFNRIDKTLSAVQGRVLRAQKRVQESKISTEDIEQRVRALAGKKASEQLVVRLELEDKAERLLLGLEQADQWLELSEDWIQGVEQTLELGNSLGAPVDVELVQPVLEQLGALRRQLKQSTDNVGGIRQRINKLAEGEGLDERIDELVRFAVRVVATLSELDSRLGESAEKLTGAQNKAQHLESKTNTFIVLAGVCALLLVAWMLAGQASLCRQGWRGLSRP